MKNFKLSNNLIVFVFITCIFLTKSSISQNNFIQYDSIGIEHQYLIKDIDSNLIPYLNNNIYVIYYYKTYGHNDYFVIYGETWENLYVDFTFFNKKFCNKRINSINNQNLKLYLNSGIYYIFTSYPNKSFYDFLFVRIANSFLSIMPIGTAIIDNLNLIKENNLDLFILMKTFFYQYNSYIYDTSYYRKIEI